MVADTGTTDRDAVPNGSIVEGLEEGDRVLFNDRVQPLRVERVNDESGALDPSAKLRGPRGGRYRVKNIGGTLSLSRQSGTIDTDKGITVPAYDSMDVTGFEVVFKPRFRSRDVFIIRSNNDSTIFFIVNDDGRTRRDRGEVNGIKIHYSNQHEKVLNAEYREIDEGRLRDMLYEGEDTGLKYAVPAKSVEFYDTEEDLNVRLKRVERESVRVSPVDEDAADYYVGGEVFVPAGGWWSRFNETND